MNVGPTVLCNRHFYVNSTCLESPTWKTDRSSRAKIIPPTFGWTGNPSLQGTECRTPQRVAPLGGVLFLVNTRPLVFIAMFGIPRLTSRTSFCAYAVGPVDRNVYGVKR